MKYFCALVLILALGFLMVECGSPCICTQQYDPVCSTSNKTYGNLCELKCAGEKLAYYGVCQDDC